MPMTETRSELDDAIVGLDALELGGTSGPSQARRFWRSTWPKLAALAIGLFIWQAVVWAGWKPRILKSPGETFSKLGDMWQDGQITDAVLITMRRAMVGFAIAIVIGIVVGSLVARIKVLRAGVGSLITGLQTMPSIAWFPLAIGLFQLSERAIYFVVILGAAPAIANGLIAGADHIPPILLRAGKVLGARGLSAFRHVVLPASLPSFVGGLKQGWAFAWRSHMAGELLVVIRGQYSVGFLLQRERELSRYDGVMAMMVVILVIGILVDALVFSTADRYIRRRWGLMDAAEA